MIRLNDFFHLPQLDPLIKQMAAGGPGLIIVAGVESHGIESNIAVTNETIFSAPEGPVNPKDAFMPSGLSTFFDILIQTILGNDSNSQAVFVAREKNLARVPRQFKRRIKLCPVEGTQTYERQVDYAVVSHPALLVIDRITEDSAAAALSAARRGLKVIASMDTPQHGAAVARQMLDLVAQPGDLAGISWVISMQRVPCLCDKCRQPAELKPAQVEHLRSRFPQVFDLAQRELAEGTRFYRPGACPTCHQTGRYGDVTVFDVYHPEERLTASEEAFDLEAMLSCPSCLSKEEYVLRLVADGRLCVDDLLWLQNDMLRRTYHMMASSEKALVEATSTLNRKLFELEATNRVLLQRTEVLISLEDLGQALIASVGLSELASRVCRRAAEVCGADRVILYFVPSSDGPADTVEVLAVRGWEGADIQKVVDLVQAFGTPAERRVMRFVQDPPGVKPRLELKPNDPSTVHIHGGLRVPLMAQDHQVGAMIIQSTQKGFFTPGETALLQTFANQAALAIQRAGLVEDLRAKIDELEAAQAELVKKERMERELELARQVQQSLLPSRFPELEGYAIAARNEPARQVGGDFYDAFVLDDDHFGVVVADVSDKGMPAALYMALSRSLLLSEARRQISPRESLRSVNRLLLELGDLNGFVSVFYGVVQRSTGVMRYTRAGHEKPWLIRAGQMFQLKGDGIVLGAVDDADLRLTEETIMLQPGDKVVMFSDGVTDVLNPTGVFFGAERFAELLVSIHAFAGQKICEQVFKTLLTHRSSADQFDDMTLLVLEVTGSA